MTCWNDRGGAKRYNTIWKTCDPVPEHAAHGALRAGVRESSLAAGRRVSKDVERPACARRGGRVTYVCVSRGRAVKQEVSDGAPGRRGEYLSALALGVGAQAAHEPLGVGQPRAQLRAGLRRARAQRRFLRARARARRRAAAL
jgi:hypothetical protein